MDHTPRAGPRRDTGAHGFILFCFLYLGTFYWLSYNCSVIVQLSFNEAGIFILHVIEFPINSRFFYIGFRILSFIYRSHL